MKKLLTIDDEPEFTAFIEGYFELRDFEVFIANSGAEGLEVYSKENPDIVLLDMKMPGMHGDEVLQEILRINSTQKVIMITASEGYGKTRERLIGIGAFACFDKPLSSLKDLEAKVKEAIEA